MRMMYEYANVTQVFSVNRFPSRWCYPINLLMMHRQGPSFQPQYCNSFYQGTAKCCYQEVVRGKEYTTELPVNLKVLSRMKNQKQEIDVTQVLSPTGSRKSIQDVSAITQQDTSSNWGWDHEQTSYMNQEDISGATGSLNLKGVWAGDEVSPASFLLSHKSANPMLHWTRQTTTRVFPVRDPGALDFEVLIHQDESLVHIRGEQGRFLKHY